MEETAQYQLYIGLSDSQAKEEYITEEEFLQAATSFFARYGIGFSIVAADGGYLYQDGSYSFEHTLIITIIGEQNLNIEKMARAFAVRLNQECLMIIKTIKKVDYR